MKLTSMQLRCLRLVESPSGMLHSTLLTRGVTPWAIEWLAESDMIVRLAMGRSDRHRWFITERGRVVLANELSREKEVEAEHDD